MQRTPGQRRVPALCAGPRGSVGVGCMVAVLGLAMWASSARAQGDYAQFERARQAYRDGEYETAAERFEELVGGAVPNLQDGVLVAESRKYLAASYVFLDERKRAKKQFELLLKQDPEQRLDKAKFPQAVLELFGQVRQRVERELERRREQRQREERASNRAIGEELLQAQARNDRLRELARTVVVERVSSRWIAALPFGAGQFQNGDTRLGIGLAVGESALFVTSLTTFLVHDALPEETSERVRARRTERALRITNWVSTGLLAAAAIAGIIDAQVRFQKVHTSTRKRELPEDLTAPEQGQGEQRGEGSGGPSGDQGDDVSVRWRGTGLQVRF